MRACFEACELGLMVHSSLGEAWIVPYKNKATFIPGYQGLVKLAFNAGFVANVTSRAVYMNDDFDCQYGAGATPGFIHLKENHAGRGALRGVMCIANLTTGADAWEYYPLEKLEHIRSLSAGYRYAKSQGTLDKDKIWGDEHNTIEMYRKAVWRNLSKWLPKSGTRYSRALEISDREFDEDFGYSSPARVHLSNYLSDDEQEEDVNDIGFITGDEILNRDDVMQSEAVSVPSEDITDGLNQLKGNQKKEWENYADGIAFAEKDDPVEQFKAEDKAVKEFTKKVNKNLQGYIHPAIEKLDDLFDVNDKAKLDVVYAITGRQEFDLLDYKDEQMDTVESMLQRMYDRLTGKRNGPDRVHRFLTLVLDQIDKGVEGWSLTNTREIDACITAFIQHERGSKDA